MQFVLGQLAKPENRVKCTLIPGDGVGPELVYSVQEVFKVTRVNVWRMLSAKSKFFLLVFQAANVPVDFETFFFSEINPVLSSKLEDVAASIRKNKICLKVHVADWAIWIWNTKLITIFHSRAFWQRQITAVLVNCKRLTWNCVPIWICSPMLFTFAVYPESRHVTRYVHFELPCGECNQIDFCSILIRISTVWSFVNKPKVNIRPSNTNVSKVWSNVWKLLPQENQCASPNSHSIMPQRIIARRSLACTRQTSWNSAMVCFWEVAKR